MGEFGDKFRKERERKELSLDDVSRVIKISTRMLRAIEEEKFDVLPGGVFNRGFIRAYAKQLGLEPEDAINEYQNCLHQSQFDSNNGWIAGRPSDPQTSIAAAPSAPQPAAPAVKVQAPVEPQELPDLQLPRMEDVRRPKKEYLSRTFAFPPIPGLRIALGLCILLAVVFLWTRHSRSAPPSPPTSAIAPSSQPAPSVTAVPPPPQSTQAPPSPPPVNQPAPATHAAAEPVQSAQPLPKTPAAARTLDPIPQETATGADPSTMQVQKKGDVTIRSFGAALAKPAEKPAPTLTLVVRAVENSWISVTADGQLVTQETLIAPAATRFHATRELVIRVGNAAGIGFLWNGQELPPQGAESEAKTFIFDAQGMRSAAPSPQN